MIYKSFYHVNFDHCPIGWHFCNQFSVNKLEKVQKMALRFICEAFESPLQDLLQNNNKKFRSFKSKENIHMREVGSYRGFGY